MQVEIRNQFTVQVKNKPELKGKLQYIAEYLEAESMTDILSELVDFYMMHAFDSESSGFAQLEDTPSAPPYSVITSSGPPLTTGPGTFAVEVNPRGIDALNTMRQDLFDQYGFEDAQILMHFVRLHRRLKKQDAFLVEAPGLIKDKVLENSESPIKRGEVKTPGEWIAKYLLTNLLNAAKRKKSETEEPDEPQPKKKKSSWWDEL